MFLQTVWAERDVWSWSSLFAQAWNLTWLCEFATYTATSKQAYDIKA